MEKFHRNERLAVLMKTLCDSPGETFTLGSFADMFGSAKSTISEDIDIVQNLLEKFDLGSIESMSGSLGGIRFVPSYKKDKIKSILNSLCQDLSNSQRILPGGYLYMLDIIYDPKKISDIGYIFAGHFYKREIDCVITVETKGIPLAFATAKQLGVPLVIARHNSEATDGPSVNINYVSGSSKKIQTMVLPMRALKGYSRLLFIDDFMKGGGTAKGIIDMVREFESEVVGIGVVIETLEPSKKLVDDYVSLLTLNIVNTEDKIIDLKPSKEWI
ncbi:pur operon repressor [Acetivibrio mesophilus]|uniref:Pur operon repressor n=1 Tax=Acetivibrio mesophilus TaxID=2487273 RepID=A0A4Q0I543_9FIRM|nr:pur operon repressor [Acetivibrio mesophilus]ODM27431.1 pur operon repressor [Clostridium sp. Bc-iso-3]RXE59391.1 pur operon repressor [Acetivibrio mesophilus]HHV30172.1 pur operon repressor [Clostridium sp.]